MPADLQKLVRQHAQTAKLLGVDFVPAFRSANSEFTDEAVGEVAQPEESPAPSHAATPPPNADMFARERAIEAKPVASSAAPAGYSGTEVQRLAGWTNPPKNSGEDASQYKHRCLAALRARYEADAPHQHFVTAHHNLVWSDGDPMSKVVFVGEAPGEDEDKQGIPFVGRAGQLLNKMIVAMGLSREANAGDKGVYICNVLKTRPPDNATPTSYEAGLCEPYLIEQLIIVNPVCIVTLGLPSTRTLLKTDASMARMRGQWQSLKIPNGPTFPVMPTYHPAYILRAYTEDNRKKVWSDLQMVMQKIK
ncbi:MAG: uracil-DNA glycosylase [Phycisphaerales bacterium]